MTEFIITVSEGSDDNFLKKVFKSIEGVIDVRVKEKHKKVQEQDDSWLQGLRDARAMFDKNLIDKEYLE